MGSKKSTGRMNRIMRARPSPGMVVALIALFVALVGTATGAPPNLRVGDPAGGDLTGTYPNPTIAADAVGAGEVANGSLGAGEFSSTIPAVHVTPSATQTIPSGASPPLAFDTEQYDTANMHNNSTDNSRLTAPVTGIYLVTGDVDWQQGSGGTRAATILKDGHLGMTSNGGWAVTGSGSEHTNVTNVLRLEAGEYVELTVFQNSSSSVDIVPSTDVNFSMTWLAPGP